MSPDLKQYELDRVVNTIKSFGWDMTSSSTEGDKVKVGFQKSFTNVNPEMKKFELDRVAGMIKNIGWSLISSMFSGDMAQVSFEKLVKPVA